MSRRRNGNRHGTGFTLIELVIVVVIIAIIGAVAIPRMSRGSQGAADAALSADLKLIRGALDRYATEHGGKYPTSADQLTGYTDEFGAVGSADSSHTLGPYLRAMPPLPVGPQGYKGSSAFTAGTGSIGGQPGGWFYNSDTGEIRANVRDTLLDTAGKKYNAY